MSLLETLLGPAPPGQAPDARSLLVDDEVVVFLREDEAQQHLILYSVPGEAPQLHDFHERQPAVSCIPHPRCEGVLGAAVPEPGTGRIFLMERWPREQVTPPVLADALIDHASRHRGWRDRLEAARAD